MFPPRVTRHTPPLAIVPRKQECSIDSAGAIITTQAQLTIPYNSIVDLPPLLVQISLLHMRGSPTLHYRLFPNGSEGNSPLTSLERAQRKSQDPIDLTIDIVYVPVPRPSVNILPIYRESPTLTWPQELANRYQIPAAPVLGLQSRPMGEPDGDLHKVEMSGTDQIYTAEIEGGKNGLTDCSCYFVFLKKLIRFQL